MFEQKGKSNKLEDIKPFSPLFECFWSCPLQVFLDQPSALHTCMVWYGMVWYSMVWYGMVWYGWYSMVGYSMIW